MNTFNPFEINIIKDINEAPHLHTDVEVIYIIEGSCDVDIKDSTFTMKKDDILLINSSIQHIISTSDKSIVCSIKYDYQIFVHVLKKPNSLFLCNSAVDKNRSYLKLQKICRDIIYQHAVSKRKTDSLLYSYLYELLDEFIENYMIDDSNAEISENYDADEKLQIIIHYVHQNYQDGISLSDLARQMYTSTSTLSRLFKKQTGTYFAEYVNQVRTRYAVNELLYTEKNMTKIAMDCGFSNASAFTKVFREIYNMAPTEYRQKMKNEVDKKEEISADIVEEISTRFDHKDEESSKIKNVDEVVVDAKHTEPLVKNWNQLVNIGFIHDILNANVQYHIQYLAKELKIQYGRVWMIFNSKTMVTDGVTIGSYNFDMIFQALDFMVENHITPWIDFTSRPYANVKSAGDNVWYEDIRIKFKDHVVWERLYEKFFSQIVRRYGLSEVSKWRFEIGMEGVHSSYDRFFVDDGFSMKGMYSYLYRVAKENIPEAKVGYAAGPGTAVIPNLGDIFTELSASDFKPDFVSYMLFPYTNEIDKENDIASFKIALDTEFEKHELEKIRLLMSNSGLADTDIVVSEWNVTVSNSNFLNDSRFRAAVFLRNVLCYSRDVTAFGLWMASDWVCNSFSTRNIINGSGGILTKQTIRKPIYYAIRMLNHMGNELVAIGKNYMVTRQAADDFQIMCFNPVFYGSNYLLSNESQTRVEEAKEFFSLEQRKTLRLILEGVSENSEYYVKRRSVNSEHGSIIDEWEKFDNDVNMERNDIKYLQEMCVPVLSRSKVVSKNNKLVLDIELEAEEFCAIHVYPVQ